MSWITSNKNNVLKCLHVLWSPCIPYNLWVLFSQVKCSSVCDLCCFSAPHKGQMSCTLKYCCCLIALFLAYPNCHFLFEWFALFRRKGEGKGRNGGRKEDENITPPTPYHLTCFSRILDRLNCNRLKSTEKYHVYYISKVSCNQNTKVG